MESLLEDIDAVGYISASEILDKSFASWPGCVRSNATNKAYICTIMVASPKTLPAAMKKIRVSEAEGCA